MTNHNLCTGWKCLTIENCPPNYNCIMYAVGNPDFAKLFQSHCYRYQDAADAFEQACKELQIHCKKIAFDEAMKTTKHLICLFAWATNPDDYSALLPYDYHVYRRAELSNTWTAKSGFYGQISPASKQELHDITNPAPNPERTFFVLE